VQPCTNIDLSKLTIQLAHSLRLILIPPFFYALWAVFAPYILSEEAAAHNPFGPLFILTGYVAGSSEDDPRYAKTWYDLAFIGYYIVFFSFVRQVIAVNIARRVARSYGIRKEGKLERFGEQFYAMIYFTTTGLLGYVRTSFVSTTNIPNSSIHRGSCALYQPIGTGLNTSGSVSLSATL
jgi:very-long-chain ceramide synthase